MTRSTGPPGANCPTTNDTSMIPKIVGIMNRMRRMMYAVIFDPADICTELRAGSQEAAKRGALPGLYAFDVLPVSYHQVSGMPRK